MTGLDLFLIIGLVIVTFLFWRLVPVTLDNWWEHFFRPATRAWLSGRNPYDPALAFFNPPWSLFFFAPFAALPDEWSTSVWFVFNVLLMLLLAYRMGARDKKLVLYALSYPVLFSEFLSGPDALALSGIWFAPQWGFILLAIKPQVTIGIMLFWLFQAWQSGSWRQVIWTLTPVTILTILTIPIWGMWMFSSSILSTAGWNLSWFPFSISLGILLLRFAWVNQRLEWSAVTSLLITPYFSGVSLFLLSLSLINEGDWFAICTLVTWGAALFQGR